MIYLKLLVKAENIVTYCKLFLDFWTLMEAASASEMSVDIYQYTQCHNA